MTFISRTFKILFVIMASAFNSVHVYKSIRRFNFYAFVSSQNHKPLIESAILFFLTQVFIWKFAYQIWCELFKTKVSYIAFVSIVKGTQVHTTKHGKEDVFHMKILGGSNFLVYISWSFYREYIQKSLYQLCLLT